LPTPRDDEVMERAPTVGGDVFGSATFRLIYANLAGMRCVNHKAVTFL